MAPLPPFCRIPLEVHYIIADYLLLKDLRILRLSHSILAEAYGSLIFQHIRINLHPRGFLERWHTLKHYAKTAKEVRFKIGVDAECLEFREYMALPKRMPRLFAQPWTGIFEQSHFQGAPYQPGQRLYKKVLAPSLCDVLDVIYRDIGNANALDTFTVDYTTNANMLSSTWFYHQVCLSVLTVAILEKFSSTIQGKQLRFLSLGFVAAVYILNCERMRISFDIEQPLVKLAPKALRVHICCRGCNMDFLDRCTPIASHALVPGRHPFACTDLGRIEVDDGVILDPPLAHAVHRTEPVVIIFAFIGSSSLRRLELDRFFLSNTLLACLERTVRYIDALILHDCYHYVGLSTWEDFFGLLYRWKADGRAPAFSRLEIFNNDAVLMRPFRMRSLADISRQGRIGEIMSREEIEAVRAAQSEIANGRKFFAYALIHVFSYTWEPDGETNICRLKAGDDHAAYDRLVALLERSRLTNTTQRP
ncbi:hypothetical protein AAP_04038 [Ascosphaera apis ARSEF 7405]|uniref:F-box domain-containing protein n=1 Tax=Ascosphaera apis ARSEF 7405 TaxID=392613 RepID=A0A167XHA0_9EURO|nr:hypothetical protein AAP_04038 [Ascosphaera apis ARSEF 7405]